MGRSGMLGSVYFDLSRTANLHSQNEQVKCFYIPEANATPLLYQGKVVGDISQGNAVNCEVISICPHGSCTHTECIGHITLEKSPVQPPPPIIKSLLVTVPSRQIESSQDSYPSNEKGDEIISSEALCEVLSSLMKSQKLESVESVIVRTAVGSSEKIKNFSGSNPPYFTPKAMEYLLEVGCKHLLVDLPSVDKEDDKGYLSAHSIFFGVPARTKGESGSPVARSASEANIA